tara:strand:+ start:391 stop:537 length:147 start_codon:yes stop_codon:yes gene_type:complete
MPEVFEIKDPPIIVNNKKNKLRLFSELIRDKPELLKLLRMLIITFKPV